jgi:carbon starvation protein CstA
MTLLSSRAFYDCATLLQFSPFFISQGDDADGQNDQHDGNESMLTECFPYTIASGAISGFHACIVSGTTPIMAISRETEIAMIGQGAMLTEGYAGLTANFGVPGLPQMDTKVSAATRIESAIRMREAQGTATWIPGLFRIHASRMAMTRAQFDIQNIQTAGKKETSHTLLSFRELRSHTVTPIRASAARS